MKSKFSFWFTIVPTVALAQNYAGAAVGAAIFLLICLILVFILHLSWLFILIKALVKKNPLSLKKKVLLVSLFSFALCLDYVGKVSYTLLTKIPRSYDFLLLPLQERKQFLMVESLDPYSCQGKLFYISKDEKIKTLIDQNYSFSKIGNFQFVFADTSLILSPRETPSGFWISENGTDFKFIKFPAEFNIYSGYTTAVYVENKTVWLITNSQDKVHIFKSEKLAEFVQVLAPKAIEKIMAKGGITQTIECHEQINKNLIDYLLKVLS